MVDTLRDTKTMEGGKTENPLWATKKRQHVEQKYHYTFRCEMRKTTAETMMYRLLRARKRTPSRALSVKKRAKARLSKKSKTRVTDPGGHMPYLPRNV